MTLPGVILRRLLCRASLCCLACSSLAPVASATAPAPLPIPIQQPTSASPTPGPTATPTAAPTPEFADLAKPSVFLSNLATRAEMQFCYDEPLRAPLCTTGTSTTQSTDTSTETLTTPTSTTQVSITTTSTRTQECVVNPDEWTNCPFLVELDQSLCESSFCLSCSSGRVCDSTCGLCAPSTSLTATTTTTLSSLSSLTTTTDTDTATSGTTTTSLSSVTATSTSTTVTTTISHTATRSSTVTTATDTATATATPCFAYPDVAESCEAMIEAASHACRSAFCSTCPGAGLCDTSCEVCAFNTTTTVSTATTSSLTVTHTTTFHTTTTTSLTTVSSVTTSTGSRTRTTASATMSSATTVTECIGIDLYDETVCVDNGACQTLFCPSCMLGGSCDKTCGYCSKTFTIASTTATTTTQFDADASVTTTTTETTTTTTESTTTETACTILPDQIANCMMADCSTYFCPGCSLGRLCDTTCGFCEEAPDVSVTSSTVTTTTSATVTLCDQFDLGGDDACESNSAYCSVLYCPTCAFAGWCDRTCDFCTDKHTSTSTLQSTGTSTTRTDTSTSVSSTTCTPCQVSLPFPSVGDCEGPLPCGSTCRQQSMVSPCLSQISMEFECPEDALEAYQTWPIGTHFAEGSFVASWAQDRSQGRAPALVAVDGAFDVLCKSCGLDVRYPDAVNHSAEEMQVDVAFGPNLLHGIVDESMLSGYDVVLMHPCTDPHASYSSNASRALATVPVEPGASMDWRECACSGREKYSASVEIPVPSTDGEWSVMVVPVLLDGSALPYGLTRSLPALRSSTSTATSSATATSASTSAITATSVTSTTQAPVVKLFTSSQRMTVDDPAAFASDPSVEVALRHAYASLAGVPVGRVAVDVRAPARRLQGSSRRLLGDVVVDYTIQVLLTASTPGAYDAVMDSLQQVTPDKLKSQVVEQLNTHAPGASAGLQISVVGTPAGSDQASSTTAQARPRSSQTSESADTEASEGSGTAMTVALVSIAVILECAAIALTFIWCRRRKKRSSMGPDACGAEEGMNVGSPAADQVASPNATSAMPIAISQPSYSFRDAELEGPLETRETLDNSSACARDAQEQRSPEQLPPERRQDEFSPVQQEVHLQPASSLSGAGATCGLDCDAGEQAEEAPRKPSSPPKPSAPEVDMLNIDVQPQGRQEMPTVPRSPGGDEQDIPPHPQTGALRPPRGHTTRL